MPSRPVAAALLLLLAPRLAFGAPATVRVFEAPARSEPRADAPVVHVFPEAAAVSVSETSEDGWRRVRLPDGTTAWIEDRSLAIVQEPPPVSAPAFEAVPPPAPAARPDLHAPIYVKDLDHLAQLVKADPVIAPEAARLATRKKAAIATWIVGAAAGLAITAYGMKQMDDEFDRAFDSPAMDQPGDEGKGAFVGGMVVTAVALVAGAIVAPKRNDLLDVINGWNQRHPEEPFEISGGHHGELSAR